MCRQVDIFEKKLSTKVIVSINAHLRKCLRVHTDTVLSDGLEVRVSAALHYVVVTMGKGHDLALVRVDIAGRLLASD